MMNATGKIRVFINEVDYSEFLVEGSISDDSAYSTSIITTTGSMKLAGSADVLDFNKNKFPIGSHVSIYVTLSNGKLAKMPRGSLLILESSINIKEPSITFELGCSLNYLSAREANYESEIEGLIDTFIPQDIKNSFVVEEKNLSTLNNLLDISGLIIFQNAYGTIQKAKKFGDDGIGSNVDAAKLVSFDKFTTIDVESLGGAIEELPSSLLVEASVEVPTFGDEDDGTEGTDGKPPPFITSSTTRTIRIPDAEAIDANFQVKNIPGSAESQSESIPGCGSISDPENDSVARYGYTVTGAVVAVEREVKETVTQGSYTSYTGPGNQVEYEYDFEHCSAGTYAGPVLNGLLNAYVDAVNNERQEAQAMAGKANQAFTQRDDFNSRPQTVIYFYEEDPETGERELVDQTLSEEGEVNAKAAEYYACIGQHYLDAAKGIAGGAESLGRSANTVVDDYLKKYGYSNYNITYYFYNPDDSLAQKITNNFIHPAASDAAQRATNGLRYNKTQTSTGFFFDEGIQYFYATGSFDYTSFRATGQSFDNLVSGDRLVTTHDIRNKDPERNFNLLLAASTVTTYKYGKLYVEEIVQYTDHENPLNSYKRINFSSTGSKNPVEPDRIEIQRDADGNIYTAGSNEQETKTEELEYEQAIKITGDSTNVQSSWLGQPGPQEKTINLPLDFAPIRNKIDDDGNVIQVNVQEKLSIYQRILEKYAKNEAKKIAADNSGFRITEVGTRAELFGYYPYYPIALNLSSLGKRYGLRAASSSWVFDKDNILCSIDCFRTSEITSSVDQDEISPYIYTVVTKVEGVSTVAPETVNVPSTAVDIQITTLPQTGTLTLSGNTISVGDVISVSDIQAGNVVFTPPTNDTTQVSFSFEVLDTNGNQVGSGDNIYPVDQYEYIEVLFADGGEFTNNTSNGGFSSGAGDFDLGTRPGGNYSLNGGDFDTGAEVVALEPQPSAIGSLQNGEADVEADYGSNVIDQDGNTIGTDQLPGPDGDNQGLLEIEIDFKFKTFNLLLITSEIILQLGWDYGFIVLSQGTPFDDGTITTPNNYNLDFGTITTPIEPALSSSVS